jgi:hypothetical protein
MSVPLAAAGFDVLRVDAPAFDPILEMLSVEFWAVFALDDRRVASALDQLAEHSNHIVRVQESSGLDPDRLARELIDHREEPKPPSVDRLVRDEVVAPDVVRVERPIDIACALASATPFSLLAGDLETFSPTDPSKTISADRKAFASKGGMDLPIAEVRISIRQRMNATNELRFFDPA